MPNIKMICRNLAKHGLYVDLRNQIHVTELMTLQSADRFVIEVRSWEHESRAVIVDIPGSVDELGWPVS